MLLGLDGELIVVKLAETFEKLAEAKLDEKAHGNFHATPAFGAGRMFLRSERNLICIEGVGP